MMIERNLRRTVLPSGLIVLTERMEHLRSVAMGVWVKSGSRCEAAEINGISHFVEHMVFKGTRSRSALHIAREMDSIGGNLDAFTGKETICFNVKSLADHVPIALDVLADELFTQNFWKDHPLGKPILGTTKTVGRLDQQKLIDYHTGRFRGGNMVFSAAGDLEHDQFVQAVAEKFAPLPPGEAAHEMQAPLATARI